MTKTAADIARMSGLEQVEYLAGSEEPFAPIAPFFNMETISYQEGEVVFAATPEPKHYNPIGTVHGGFAATLLDSACGTAVHTTLRPGQAYTSLEIKVNFLRAMTAETGRVTVRGWVVRPGSKAAYAEADIRDADGRILASASSTCAVFETQ